MRATKVEYQKIVAENKKLIEELQKSKEAEEEKIHINKLNAYENSVVKSKNLEIYKRKQQKERRERKERKKLELNNKSDTEFEYYKNSKYDPESNHVDETILTEKTTNEKTHREIKKLREL